MLTGEGQNDLQLPPKLERDFSSQLIGPVCDRRHEPPTQRHVGETVALVVEQILAGAAQLFEQTAQPDAKRIERVRPKHVRAVPGNPDTEHERQTRRSRGRSQLRVLSRPSDARLARMDLKMMTNIASSATPPSE